MSLLLPFLVAYRTFDFFLLDLFLGVGTDLFMSGIGLFTLQVLHLLSQLLCYLHLELLIARSYLL
jgi:hypothetical protein